MGDKIRVVVVARGLVHPFSLAFLPNGDALVTERGTKLRIVRNATAAGGAQAVLDPQAIAGLPEFPAFRTGGLQEIALHPKFATNPDRLAHHADFKARVEARLATAPTADWVKRFESVSVAAGPIYEFDEVFADAARARPRRRAASRGPAPLLGEHTREVLRELGLPDAETTGPAEAGAVQLRSDG